MTSLKSPVLKPGNWVTPAPHGFGVIALWIALLTTGPESYAQSPDTLAPEQLLQTVIVQEGTSNWSTTNLRQVESFAIYAGKKTEQIDLSKLTANVSTNNPRQIFGRITGLHIWESDGAGLQLGIGGRGLNPNRTANFNTRQNGYDISADALGYPESYYTPPMEALERIEVVRGAASLQYGTQFGGLLNFRFKQPSDNKKVGITSRQTLGSWGYLASFNSLEGHLVRPNIRYYTCFQLKRGDGWRPNSGFDQQFAYADVHWHPSKRLMIEFEYTRMDYTAQQPGGLTDKMFESNPRQSVRERNWFYVDWNIGALQVNYDFSDNTRLNVRTFGLSSQRKSLGQLERINVVDQGSPRTLIEGLFQNVGQEARLIHQYARNERPQTLLIGYRLYQGNTTSRQGAASDGSGPEFNFLNPGKLENSDYAFPSNNQALFAEHLFVMSPHWTITPGIRLENIQTRSGGYYQQRVLDAAGNVIVSNRITEQQVRHRTFLIAGLGTTMKASPYAEWYANVSQNYRAINFSDLRIVNPNIIVDSNIRDERGFTADLGLRWRKAELLSAEITAFYIAYNGRIGQVLRADRPPLYNDYRFRTNIADARNIGLETFLELNMLHGLFKINSPSWQWTIFLNAALVDARYTNTPDKSIQGKKVEMAPPILFRTGTSGRLNNFEASLQYSFTAAHFSDASNAQRTASAVEGVIPAYSIIDFSARWRFHRFTVEGSCNNLLNTPYFSRRAESYPGPGIIPSDGRGFYFTVGYSL